MFERDEELQESVERMLQFVRTKCRGSIVEMLRPEFQECNVREQTLTLRYKAQEWYRNGRGQVHGGITAALFDQSMGTMVRSIVPADKAVMTAELSVSYLRPLQPGDDMRIKVQIKSFGKLMIRLYGELFANESDRPSATSTSLFVVKQ